MGRVQIIDALVMYQLVDGCVRPSRGGEYFELDLIGCGWRYRCMPDAT